MVRVLLMLALLLVSCEGAPPPRPDQSVKQVTKPRPTVLVNKRGVRGLLSDREAPLPTKAQLDVHGDADVALRELALSDSSMAVRKRAISSLANYPNRQTRQLLGDMAKAEKLQKDLRQAAQVAYETVEATAASQSPDSPSH
jgi:hypothetical protein